MTVRSTSRVWSESVRWRCARQSKSGLVVPRGNEGRGGVPFLAAIRSRRPQKAGSRRIEGDCPFPSQASGDTFAAGRPPLRHAVAPKPLPSQGDTKRKGVTPPASHQRQTATTWAATRRSCARSGPGSPGSDGRSCRPAVRPLAHHRSSPGSSRSAGRRPATTHPRTARHRAARIPHPRPPRFWDNSPMRVSARPSAFGTSGRNRCADFPACRSR